MSKDYRRSVSFQLAQLGKLQNARARALLAEAALHPGQEKLLAALSGAESLSMGELAEALGVKPPTATKAVSRLAAQGLIERLDQSVDGRAVLVRLTGPGRALAEKTGGIWQKIEADMLSEFDAKALRRLRKGLKRAAKNLAGAAGFVKPAKQNPQPES